jgi:hypothetical protein
MERTGSLSTRLRLPCYRSSQRIPEPLPYDGGPLQVNTALERVLSTALLTPFIRRHRRTPDYRWSPS